MIIYYIRYFFEVTLYPFYFFHDMVKTKIKEGKNFKK